MGKASSKPGHAQPAPGEDNNTRLAFLETENVAQAAAIKALNEAADAVSSKLGEALLAAGIGPVEGGNPIDQAVHLIGNWKDRTLALAEAIVAGEHDLNEGEGPHDAAVRILSAEPGAATDGEIAASARADRLEERVKELEAALAAVKGGDNAPAEIVDLTTASKRDNAAECGPLGQRSSSEEIRGFIEEGAELELVFSDGSAEILDFHPVPVAGKDLHVHNNNLLFAPEITVDGPRGEGCAAIAIDGAALLVNGEQVDYCQLDRPIMVNPGDRRRFDRAFTFGG